MQHTDQLDVAPTEQAAVPQSADQLRIRNLETRVKFLEDSFQELVRLVQKSEATVAKKMLGAMSGAFHQISDQLALTARGPHPMQYFAKRVPEGTEQSVVVTRKGEQYDFATSVDPTKIENDGTEELAIMFKMRELLQDGETAWFHITLGEAKGGTGDGATDVPATPAS